MLVEETNSDETICPAFNSVQNSPVRTSAISDNNNKRHQRDYATQTMKTVHSNQNKSKFKPACEQDLGSETQ